MFLAIKEIKKEKLRFIMIILVTALIGYLVYFLSSLAYGLAQINRTAIDYWPAEGIVLTQAANENIYASTIDTSTLTEMDFQKEQAITVASTAISSSTSDEPEDTIFIGYDLSNPDILPPLIEGRLVETNEEAVISTSLQDILSIEIGETFTVLTTQREFVVVGISAAANYNTRPVIYVEQNMASQVMMSYITDTNTFATPQMPERISALLVNGIPDQNILDTYNLSYIPIDTFINGLPGYQAQVLTFGLMIISLSLIASIIIGIFMYILTMQKRPVFGVLKIQGYQNKYIMHSVIYQALILVSLGFISGFILTNITIALLPKTVPIAINWTLYFGVTFISLLFSMIGVFFSARSILKIDPLKAL